MVALGVAVFGVATSVRAETPGPVLVVDVRDPFDQRILDFLTRTVREADAQVVILKVDSPGIASGDPTALYATIRDAAFPVVVWVGATPAVAYGGVAGLLNVADLGAAAPETRVGLLEPVVVRGAATIPLRRDHGTPEEVEASFERLRREAVTVAAPVPGFVDRVVPTIGQLVVDLDGATFTKGGRVVRLTTARTEETTSGTARVPTVEVRFLKPGLLDRFLRLGARPETAFLFLVVGIAIATFEFYAAGVGVSAAVAVVALVLSGYGLAVLPVWWPAVGATVAGLLLYTWEFQRNELGWRSLLGTLLLAGGGLTFTRARPQFGPSWWVVLVIVTGTALFYGVALTTITRSRFSTPTIGRSQLLGRVGVATTDLDPEGVVEVDGARWRARSHRAAGIVAGDAIEVLGVDGVTLEVGPFANS